MSLVELECFADATLAAIVRGRLEVEGIEVVLLGAGMAGLGLGHLAPARLMVEERDRLRAERLLAELPK